MTSPRIDQMTYQIVTNLSCNLDCEYCYERKYARNNTAESIKSFLTACFNRDLDKDIQTVIVDIIGGEPFMQPKLLTVIYETALALGERDNRKVVFSISTNGTLFDNKANQTIIEKWGHLTEVGVSIDGIRENHDKYRIYVNTGKPSYDKAVAGYNYLIGKVKDLGIKATFTMDTIHTYAAGMKNIIDIAGGWGTISGNVVFEDVIPRSYAPSLANQFIEIMEYWVEKGYHLNRYSDLTFLIGESGWNVFHMLSPEVRTAIKEQESVRNDEERIRPFCGSIKYMTCLGFDNKVYGCNRWMSSNLADRSVIGHLVGEEIIIDEESNLKQEVEEQYKDYPDWCMACPLKASCGSCAAAPYEYKDGGADARKEYHSQSRQCGWTHGLALAKMFWYSKHGTWNALYEYCQCDECKSRRGEL